MRNPDQILLRQQVPLGSVTPLAVANPSAAGVVLLLDEKLRSAPSLCVHPLVNTATLLLSPSGLEAALTALGREAIYVDLEADPKIDKENPPDLAKYVPAADAVPSASGAAAAPAPASAAPVAPAAKPAAAKAAAAKPAAAAAATPQQAPPLPVDLIIDQARG